MALEFFGLVLAGSDVYRRKQRVEDYFHRRITLYPEGDPVVTEGGPVDGLTVTPTPEPPSIEQRVMSLEDRHRDLARYVDAQDRLVFKEAMGRTREIVGNASRQATDEANRLRELVEDELGNWKWTGVGVALFVVGLALQAVGTLMSGAC